MVEQTGLQIPRVKDLGHDVLNVSFTHLNFRCKNLLKQQKCIVLQFGG